MTETAKKLDNKLIAIVGVVFGLTLLLFFGLRFVFLQKYEVHYHANFAVFVDGERLPFEKFTFYEEVEACGGNGIESPKIRVHMHDQINHVLHVHDNGATWGHFFANLSYVVGNDFIQTDEGLFVENGENTLTFILNGEETSTVYNKTIGNEDVLLISYGSESDEQLQDQYSQIQVDAAEYNEKDDPSACSGGKPFTTSERFKQALQFWE